MENATRTQDLFEAVHHEMTLARPGSNLLLEGLNTDSNSSKMMNKLITLFGWSDVATMPSAIREHPQPTCTTRRTKTATRQDYVLANNDCVSLAIKAVAVDKHVNLTCATQSRFNYQPQPKDFLTDGLQYSSAKRVRVGRCESAS